MAKEIAPNLITYRVYLDGNGEEFVDALINTTLLTGIRYTKGFRWCKEDAIKRRLLKFWYIKHPFLSKFFTPPSLWFNDCWDEWKKAKLIIRYVDKDYTIAEFKSTKLAKETCDLMIKHFWKKAE